MRTTDPKTALTADVYCGDVLAGHIRRIPAGSEFAYDEEFLRTALLRGTGIAFHLPMSQRVFRVSGGGVHPFFAGLLPEGLRLTALAQRVKTSLDDHLSLLLAAGSDPIGDVCVTGAGEQPWRSRASIDVRILDQSDFVEAFQRTLSEGAAEPPPPVFPGVQDKVSGQMISMPVRGRGRRADYILKLNPQDKPTLVHNEFYFLRMAKACGLEIPSVRLGHDRNGVPGLLVQRFDRVYEPGATQPRRLHVEDGCQFLNLYPASKYAVSVRRVIEAIADLASAPEVEVLHFLRLYALSYLIANGDLHARNVSLLRRLDGRVTLSPTYDLLTTLPYGDARMALKLEGRDQDLERKHFIAAGQRAGVPAAAVNRMLDRLTRKAAEWVEGIGTVGFEGKAVEHLKRTMHGRLADLAQ